MVPDLYPAVARLSVAIVRAVLGHQDPRTFSMWASAAGASRSTLRAWCRAAGVEGRRALWFTRALRAVLAAEDEMARSSELPPPALFLDVVRVSGSAFIGQLGIDLTNPLTADEFFDRQCAITNVRLVLSVKTRLHESSLVTHLRTHQLTQLD